ncbi:SH3 domain-containing protein [Spirochaeta africana]|uniref:SH3 domain-containing protein n=1 Tax=Spirochaeta africana (strain ATCC 700263 / DSM 8902 / Z-7692) TaxID=889378 RepID=H9ULT3_SPIAZ|nr:SH3 domain-containing protein [Spirochaeta africana]AFG38476.1 SH3 domain-containing protein [Spirochaeta africana DSM 8902]
MRILFRSGILMLLALALGGITLTVGALEGTSVSISVRSAQLRQNPGHLAPVIGQLSYTDQVQITEMRGDFLQVEFEGRRGWLHRSAVSKRQIVLQDTGTGMRAEADRDEVALAGRGFNEQVEENYRSRSGIDFSAVDHMEQRRYREDELRRFLADGDLIQDAGGGE